MGRLFSFRNACRSSIRHRHLKARWFLCKGNLMSKPRHQPPPSNVSSYPALLFPFSFPFCVYMGIFFFLSLCLRQLRGNSSSTLIGKNGRPNDFRFLNGLPHELRPFRESSVNSRQGRSWCSVARKTDWIRLWFNWTVQCVSKLQKKTITNNKKKKQQKKVSNCLAYTRPTAATQEAKTTNKKE